MRKLIFTLAIVVMAASASAQMYLGGGLSIANKNGNTNFGILPEVGYQINYRWSVGAVLGYSHYASEMMSDTKVNAWSIEPYARYAYFRQGVVSLFLDGGVEYMSMKETNSDAKSTEAFAVGIKPGIRVQLSQNVSLISRFGFAGYRNDNHPGPSGLTLDTKALSLGFFYNF